jgi:hypothetical protein
MRRCLFLLLHVLLTLLTQALADTGDRVALVIGNSAYPRGKLINPRNDAIAVAKLLRNAGFDVREYLDTPQAQLHEAIQDFGQAIRNPKVRLGMFYYAGHGLQQDWRNYLVPVSADIQAPEDVQKQTVDVSELLGYMGQAKGRSFVVILDACRDDPFAGVFRPAAKGLSQFDAPPGSLLAFATAPGNVAFDGEGSNGLYTDNLLKEFSVRGARIEDAFKRVRLHVRIASNGRQVPWETTSLEEELYLFPGERQRLSDADREKAFEAELADWTLVKTTGRPELLADFLMRYPSGYVSELAQWRLNQLWRAQVEQENAAIERRKSASEAAAREEADRRQADKQRQAATEAARREERKNTAPANPPVADSSSALPPPVATVVPAPAPVPEVVIAPTPYFKGFAEHDRRFHVGDAFQYRTTDRMTRQTTLHERKVTRVDASADRVEFDNGAFVTDFMGNTVANDVGQMGTPRQFYPAEFYVGKKWQTKFRQQRADGSVFNFKYDMHVASRETISVPAGTFDAFRIEARGFNLELGTSLVRTIWVAPGVPVDIAHETLVRPRSGGIEQYERRELVSIRTAAH